MESTSGQEYMVIQMLLSSAFEDPGEFKGLSPDVQAQLLNSKAFQYKGARYGLEGIFVPRGFAVALTIIQRGNRVAVSYGFAKAGDNSPESFMEADRIALERAYNRAMQMLGGAVEISSPSTTTEVAEKEEKEERKAPTKKLETPVRSYERVTSSKEEKVETPRINYYQKKFFSLVAKLNWSLDKAKSFLRKHTGKESTKDVEPEEWNKILALLEEQLRGSSSQEIEEDEWEELFK